MSGDWVRECLSACMCAGISSFAQDQSGLPEYLAKGVFVCVYA